MGTAFLAGGVSNRVNPLPGMADLSDLYRQHADSIYLTALRVTGNAADAEDVLQSVFLRIVDHGLSLDPMRQPAHYLRRAATNAAIDLLRKRAVLPEAGIEDWHAAASNEKFLVAKDRLRRALASIPAQDAELFVLCYLEGYSYDELAEQFAVERSTIGSRLHRIRAVLQQYLTK
jgi:RNA polymerase sigma-70 factor (ECF subfamily)